MIDKNKDKIGIQDIIEISKKINRYKLKKKSSVVNHAIMWFIYSSFFSLNNIIPININLPSIEINVKMYLHIRLIQQW